MGLRIAFIAPTARMTSYCFKDLAEQNKDQISMCDLLRGRIVLLDGTEIRCLHPGDRLLGYALDQVIVAEDCYRRVGEINYYQDIQALTYCLRASRVPPEFQWQHYDIDTDRQGGQHENQ